ncbi:hypothetical protein B5E56_00720 [Flavonifractor sp. An112]|uniref:protein phosphatase 2C domain-containing protein n=1 Tax=Flavonifractor sp. An112 TaxID=1965544 RepID=UPI000B3A1FF6|nr:protein phosphatase 2C domain-containing protein [Flavonifractor sp. An112]OUQ61831.1 hypothetical protein B5E56_00720 [Flavonifractor sp. An112]
MISKEEQHGDLYAVVITDTGISHRLSNTPNQDAVLYAFMEDDFVLAVSDGVGSCPKAALGSKMAVRAAVKVFEQIRQNRCQKHELPQRLIAEWTSLLNGEKLDDCCATLKIAMKLYDRMVLVSLGDGVLVMTSNGLKVKAPSDEMPFANQTRCLSSFVSSKEIWIEEVHLDLHISYVVFMCTDGIANGLRDGSEYELVREIEENTPTEKLKDELELLTIDISDFSLDDRTLGVVKCECKNAGPER